MKISKTKWRSN